MKIKTKKILMELSRILFFATALFLVYSSNLALILFSGLFFGASFSISYKQGVSFGFVKASRFMYLKNKVKKIEESKNEQ